MGTTVKGLVKKDEDDIQMSFSFLWMIILLLQQPCRLLIIFFIIGES